MVGILDDFGGDTDVDIIDVPFDPVTLSAIAFGRAATMPVAEATDGVPVPVEREITQRYRFPVASRAVLTIGLLVALAGACVRLPHVDPQPRDQFAAQRAVVGISVSCSERDPFASGDPALPPGPPVVWKLPVDGTGVVISERHVITAEHVVRCPIIPAVSVTLSDGRTFKMVVDRDDYMFGDGTEVARLEIASAENFGLNIAPPSIAPDGPSNGEAWIGDSRCAATVRGRACGARDLFHPDIALGLRTRPGDSGAGMYNDADQLIGVANTSGLAKLPGDTTYDTPFTRFTPVDARWLEGT